MTRPADPARDADVEAVRKAFGEMVCCYLPPYGEHLEASCPEGSDGRAANATAKAALARIERRLAVLPTADDVEWVVNSIGDLGVKIGDRFFWLYKGRSLVYGDSDDDGDEPLLWRHVGKREFGETCKPLRFDRNDRWYAEGDDWKPLPPQPAALEGAPDAAG